MYCQRRGLRLAVTRAITALQRESNLCPRRDITRLSSSAWIYPCIHVRLFSSESDLQNKHDEKTKATSKERLEEESKCKDSFEQVFSVNKQNGVSNFSTSLSDDEKHLEPALSVLTDEKKLQSTALKTISVVPGKGPPPEPPITCCMSGCANCVWIMYAEELRDYYKDGGEQAKLALEKIEDPSLRAFVKLELGL